MYAWMVQIATSNRRYPVRVVVRRIVVRDLWNNVADV